MPEVGREADFEGAAQHARRYLILRLLAPEVYDLTQPTVWRFDALRACHLPLPW